MRSLIVLALSVVLAACSSTVTGSGSTQSPDASQEVDGYVVPDTRSVDVVDPDAPLTTDKVVVADADSDDVEVVIVMPDADTDVAADASVDAEVGEDVIDVLIPDAPSPDVSLDVGEADVPVASSFEIEPYEMPGSFNIVPGSPGLFATFRGRSHGENATMRRLRVPIHGHSVSVREVAIVSFERGMISFSHGAGIPSTGADPHVDIEFTTPMQFVRDQWKVFSIVGVMSPIQARSSVPPGTPAAFSGSYIQMGLEAGETGGSWGPSYVTSFNTDVIGDDSRTLLYAPGRTTFGTHRVVRRSRPHIHVIPPASSPFIVVEMLNVLYDWEIEAEHIGGNLSWRKMTFMLETEGDSTLSEFQLLRNGVAVPLADYEIVDGMNRDLLTLLRLSGTFYVTIRWRNEEVIESGVRHAYRLIALPRGGTTGDTIRTTPLRSGHALPGTGWMTGDDYGLMIGGRDVAGPSFIQMIASTGSTATVPAAFLWSDLSEVPHVARPYPMGSNDWTDDGLLNDLVPTYVRFAP